MSDLQLFKINGMKCNGCVGRIVQSLSIMPEVLSVDVTLDPPQARIDATRPISGSELVAATVDAGEFQFTSTSTPSEPTAKPGWQTYLPLLLLVGFLALASLIVQLRSPTFSLKEFMSDFMGGFFLAFAYLKLLDLRGFATTFRTYDLVAEKLPAYAWVYPFVEAGLGVAFLLRFAPRLTSIVTIVIMLVGTAGVALTLRSGQKIRCACMGTVFNLPMTTVTVVENLGMALMAGLMLL
ncbi:MAG: heavy metal-associated domain-containing protein [Planctomycetota bacterium]